MPGSEPVRILCRMTLGFPELRAACAALPGLTLLEAATETALLDALPDADGLIVFNNRYTAEVAAAAEAAPRLKWLQFATAGVDAAVTHGVPDGCLLCNARDVWAPTVAEHALALLLGLLRQVHHLERTRRSADWSRDALTEGLGSLQGRTLVIVGFGTIGREVALRAKAFGCRIVGVMREPRSSDALDEALPLDRLPEALASADAVVLAIALAPTTRHLIDRAALAALKPSAVLVNVARGEIVEEAALVEVLAAGRLAGAGLDVFAVEPLPLDSPLRALPNVILSPHLAGFGDGGTVERLVVLCRDNIERFLAGRPLRNVVAL